MLTATPIARGSPTGSPSTCRARYARGSPSIGLRARPPTAVTPGLARGSPSLSARLSVYRATGVLRARPPTGRARARPSTYRARYGLATGSLRARPSIVDSCRPSTGLARLPGYRATGSLSPARGSPKGRPSTARPPVYRARYGLAYLSARPSMLRARYGLARLPVGLAYRPGVYGLARARLALPETFDNRNPKPNFWIVKTFDGSKPKSKVRMPKISGQPKIESRPQKKNRGSLVRKILIIHRN